MTLYEDYLYYLSIFLIQLAMSIIAFDNSDTDHHIGSFDNFSTPEIVYFFEFSKQIHDWSNFDKRSHMLWMLDLAEKIIIDRSKARNREDFLSNLKKLNEAIFETNNDSDEHHVDDILLALDLFISHENPPDQYEINYFGNVYDFVSAVVDKTDATLQL